MNRLHFYKQLHTRLLNHPAYMGMSGKERPACTAFALRAARLGTTDPDSIEMELAYERAVVEARGLVEQGKLAGLELPEPGGIFEQSTDDHAVPDGAMPEPSADEAPMLAADPAVAPDPGSDGEPPKDGRRRYTKRVTLADLRPNKTNHETYKESLGDESVGALAENR
jgi:hypothetical protein